MVRVLFLGAGLDAASWRFRVGQYLPHLRQHGVQAEVADLDVAFPHRLRVLAGAARYDRVFVHRVLLSPIELVWLRRVAPRYVFDFDDAIMLRDSAARRLDSWQRRWGFARMLRAAGAVIAGNAYLGEHARRHAARVTVIPTAVDLTPYPASPADPGAPVVGWMGTSSNLMYLRAVVPALVRLAGRRAEMHVKVVSDGVFAAPNVRLTQKRWSRDDEVADLRTFQIGIMPLPDDAWTRGKCAVKILQYFAAGLPVVCSPVGANCEIVEAGVSGLFAATHDEWVARLDELLGDPALRRRLGQHGRAAVRERYSIEATLPRLLDVLLSP
jgi:glycosyltransferase involved in cell wall biosynthesis